jgi:pyridoxal/pyridoxine/pyridoxamine kinase
VSDDDIIQQRISGRSVRAIAKAAGIAVAEVNRVLDRFTVDTVSDQARRHTLALELARMDLMEQVYFSRAMNGDVQSAQLVAKLTERRCVMLGLHAPQTAVLQIVQEAAPKETSTDRIEAALNALLEHRSNGGGNGNAH